MGTKNSVLVFGNVENNVIVFNTPFNVGDRLIVEVRETITATGIGIVLYDLEGKPYNVIISDEGKIIINKINKYSFFEQLFLTFHKVFN